MDELQMKRLEHKLSPDSIKSNLQNAAMYLVAYELLRRAIVDELKVFYLVDVPGITSAGMEREYEEEVSGRHKKVYEASCLWLAEQGIFDDADIAELQRIRAHRDQIAHELPRLMFDPSFDVDLDLLRRMRHYVGAVGRYWGSVNASLGEIPADEIDYDGIVSMGMLLLDYITATVDSSGSEKGVDS